MRRPFTGSTKTIVIAVVTAAVTAMGTALAFNIAPAVAHGVKHAKYAHNADKVDGKHANQLRPIAEGRSYSFQGLAPIHTVAATPTNILQFQFKAPRKGYVQVSYAHTDYAMASDQDVNSWVEIDPATDCDGSRRLNATEMFNTVDVGQYGNTSATAVVPASKGSHRLILCVAAEAGGVQVGVASLSGTFIPAGQVSIAVPPAPRPGAGERFGR